MARLCIIQVTPEQYRKLLLLPAIGLCAFVGLCRLAGEGSQPRVPPPPRNLLKFAAMVRISWEFALLPSSDLFESWIRSVLIGVAGIEEVIPIPATAVQAHCSPSMAVGS